MLKVGDTVMVRDPSIKEDYHVPPAIIKGMKSCPVLFSKQYLLEFENGKQEWFLHWELKTQ